MVGIIDVRSAIDEALLDDGPCCGSREAQALIVLQQLCRFKAPRAHVGLPKQGIWIKQLRLCTKFGFQLRQLALASRGKAAGV